MSFLQRYFTTSKGAPVSPPPPPTEPIPTSTAPITTTSEPDQSSSWFSPRSRKQLGLFWAGAGFFMLSSLVTRRALMRRYVATKPKFYQPSNKPVEVNGAMEAFDALNLATINVLSVAIMVAGGVSWVFDISSVEDMRRRTRDALGTAGAPVDGNADEEMEEWIAGVLARKDWKELARKAKEVEEAERERRRKEKEEERR